MFYLYIASMAAPTGREGAKNGKWKMGEQEQKRESATTGIMVF